MKHTFYLLLLLTAGTLWGCSDDENNEKTIVCPFERLYPDVAQITISETISSDGGTVSKKDTYSFSDSRLENHITAQEFYGQSISYEVKFSYSENMVTFTDDAGNTAIYIIGYNGYAHKCIYQMHSQTREYDFSYTYDYLTEIKEKIDGESYSSVQLQYDTSGNLQTINANGQKILCQTGNVTNEYNLPCTALYDVYPLSFHIDAIYARILGRQSSHLVTRTAPEGNEDEWTEYVYQVDDRNKPTKLTASTTSTGTVYDIHGVASEVTRTDTRALYIQIE